MLSGEGETGRLIVRLADVFWFVNVDSAKVDENRSFVDSEELDV